MKSWKDFLDEVFSARAFVCVCVCGKNDLEQKVILFEPSAKN